MRPIPPKLRREMEADPFYQKCCITGKSNEKIDWHHNMTWKGRQLNMKFCILPLAKSVHDNIVKYKEICDWIMLNRMTEQELIFYSKATNYIRERDRLNGIYGKFSA